MMQFLTDQRLVTLLYLLVIATQILDTLASSLSANTQVIVVVVRVAPLLLLVSVVFNATPRSLIWLCFLLLGYFVGATLGAFSPARTIWDFVALGATSLLFISAMFRSRHLSQLLNNDVPKD